MEIQLWKDILNPYELAVEELLVKFNHLIKEYQDRGMYSPMEQVCGRVKSISSILDKAQKKKLKLTRLKNSWMISQASASSASLWRILRRWQIL